MKLCKSCNPLTCICDFCKHYQFNGKSLKQRYFGNGCCKLHFLPSHPTGVCEYFYCIKYDEDKKEAGK